MLRAEESDDEAAVAWKAEVLREQILLDSVPGPSWIARSLHFSPTLGLARASVRSASQDYRALHYFRRSDYAAAVAASADAALRERGLSRNFLQSLDDPATFDETIALPADRHRLALTIPAAAVVLEAAPGNFYFLKFNWTWCPLYLDSRIWQKSRLSRWAKIDAALPVFCSGRASSLQVLHGVP